MAFAFTKYAQSGSLHWREMQSKSLLTFNAHQQARYDVALRALGDVAGKTVIDLGAGDGALSSLIARKGAQVIAVDNEPKGLELAAQNFATEKLTAQFMLGSVEQVPLPSSSAACVMSCDVIEHLDHPDKHVAEIARILKPGGIAVITTPYRICETPAPFHTHEFYPSELRKLADPFFDQITIRETHHMFWNAFFNYRPKTLGRIHLGRIFINVMTLWLRSNPFLADSSRRKKRDYYTQLTMRGVRR